MHSDETYCCSSHLSQHKFGTRLAYFGATMDTGAQHSPSPTRHDVCVCTI